jgi:hypothetical protein
MASITIDPKENTLQIDSLAGLGVTIEQIEFRCTSCGGSFMTPVPSASGKFPRGWYECPRGCNKVKAGQTPAGKAA